jgi:hypothetical protein
MRNLPIALTLGLGLLHSAFARPVTRDDLAPLDEIKARINRYSEFFYENGELPSDYLDVLTLNKVAKTRQFRTVLPGLLYRGGGARGTVPLSMQALESLCEAGFSAAIYGYTDGYSDPGPIECVNSITGEDNTLRYIAVDANTPEGKTTVLKQVYAALIDASKGPVFVHCWNGYHASGELAAISLKQVCMNDWGTGSNAASYWHRLANGAAMISRVGRFVPNDDLELPADYQRAICIQRE